MREVTHRRHEPIGERRHVPHAGAVRGLGHGLGVGGIQGERLFAKHVFAVGDGVQRDGRMGEVRRGDDHGVNVVAPHDVLVPGGGDA